MKKQEMIDTLKAVIKYEDHGHATGVFNVGQMAKVRVRDKLSVRRGDSLAYAIETAKFDQLKNVYDYLQRYIDHMHENPVDKCPLCRSLTRRADFRKNTFVVEFAANYIPTLVKQVGMSKAIKRIVEEASVSLKIQAGEAIADLTKR